MGIRLLSADFETTQGDRTNVWLWGASNIATREFEWGETIEGFIDYVHSEPTICYFHNLGFDGCFLLDWYLKNEFTWVLKGKLQNKQIATTISDMGAFYKIVVNYGSRVTYKDSLKIIPLPVEKIPKAFGLGNHKRQMDYSAHRYGDYIEPTDDDIEYLKADCEIVADALAIMFSQGMAKLTTGANAMAWYKDKTPEYEQLFPELTPTEDEDIRKAYKGAWTYCNPAHQKKMCGTGQVYDVNSMYAWAMRYNMLPYGKPIWIDGKPESTSLYPLWVAAVRMDIRLKPDKFPCVQLKKNPKYVSTEYLSATDGPAIMHLTNVDYDLIHFCYDVVSEEFIGGYRFMARDDLFSEYIDYWYGKKAEHSETGNAGLRYIDKQMLVNLYGKFGTNPVKDIKMPYIEEEKVKFKRLEMPKKYDGYVPMATFITSYCRNKIVRDACSLGGRFCYADTDSLHILGEECPDIPIHETQLGAYKREATFTEAMYFRPKLYIETINGELAKTAAGLPKKARGPLNYETMVAGMEFDGKLQHKIVPGGAVLIEQKFKIKG